MQWRRTEYRGKEKKTKVRGLIEKTQNTNKKKRKKKNNKSRECWRAVNMQKKKHKKHSLRTRLSARMCSFIVAPNEKNPFLSIYLPRSPCIFCVVKD